MSDQNGWLRKKRPGDDCSPPEHKWIGESSTGSAVAATATGTSAVPGSPTLALALALTISLAFALAFSFSIADAVIRAIATGFLELLLSCGTFRVVLRRPILRSTPAARSSLSKDGSGGECGDENDDADVFGFHDCVCFVFLDAPDGAVLGDINLHL